MEALADVGVLASWSPLHKQVEVIDYYPDGRPHHVRATVKILGLVDKEVLEYHWGPDGERAAEVDRGCRRSRKREIVTM